MPDSLKHHLDALPPQTIMRISGDANVIVTAPFTEDSRQVQPGAVFVARKGRTVDGHEYIQRAIEQGAAAIVGERSIDLDTEANFQYLSQYFNLLQTTENHEFSLISLRLNYLFSKSKKCLFRPINRWL